MVTIQPDYRHASPENNNATPKRVALFHAGVVEAAARCLKKSRLT
jgi:hypothetical protein